MLLEPFPASLLTLPKPSEDTQTLSKLLLCGVALIAKVILSSLSQKINLRFLYLRNPGLVWRNSNEHNDWFVNRVLGSGGATMPSAGHIEE